MKKEIVLLLTLTAIGLPVKAQDWIIGPCKRESDKPVITPRQESSFKDPLTGTVTHWEALHTFNPAAIIRNGKIIVIYRAEDDSGEKKIGGHVSRLGMAESTDGIHFQRSPEPVFYPDNDAQASRESPGGVEDPRIVEREDGVYILTYTQWSRDTHTFSIGLASSKDLQHWQKHGPIFGNEGKYAHLRYKSSGIVTKLQQDRLVAAKINGKYWMYWGEGEIHLASSEDLIHWRPVEDSTGVSLVLLKKRPGKSDSNFPEVGPPAVLTEEGIVLIYNAKNAAGPTMDAAIGASAYTAQEALFAADDPSHLLGRTDKPVLAPLLDWEKSGQYVAGTTFAEGLIPFHGQWWLYYGSADSFVGVASCGDTFRTTHLKK